jgi:hypothetical protein
MTSRERMLSALSCMAADHVPCSFMLFHNLYNLCGSDGEYVERQLELGLDACVHVGHLNPDSHKYGMFHPDVKVREWIEEREGVRHFCLRLDTPAGPLTGRVRQREGWPKEGEFSLLNDFVVPRAVEPLVKPERDLEKLRYLFGPFKDEDIEALREEASRAKAIAESRGLLLTGGWKGSLGPGLYVDPGVMGCDAMAWLSGFEEVMALSITAPEVISEYARIIHEWNMKQIEIYLEVTGAELIIRRGWYETTEFWTPGGLSRYRRAHASAGGGARPPGREEVRLHHHVGVSPHSRRHPRHGGRRPRRSRPGGGEGHGSRGREEDVHGEKGRDLGGRERGGDVGAGDRGEHRGCGS